MGKLKALVAMTVLLLVLSARPAHAASNTFIVTITPSSGAVITDKNVVNTDLVNIDEVQINVLVCTAVAVTLQVHTDSALEKVQATNLVSSSCTYYAKNNPDKIWTFVSGVGFTNTLSDSLGATVTKSATTGGSFSPYSGFVNDQI